MSLAIAPNRRRQILWGGVTVLLHLAVLDWFTGQLDRPREERVREAAPVTEAELLATPQPAPARPAPPPPQPAFEAPPPLPQLPLEPVEVAQAPAPALNRPGGDAAPEAPGGLPAGGEAPVPGKGSALEAVAGVQSGQPPASQASQASAPQPAPDLPHYKLDLPPAAEILLDVARTDANGTKWSGEATLSWTLGPNSYRVQVEAGIRVVFAHVNLLTLTSEGTLGDEGFTPVTMTEKRRGRAMTATHFDRKTGRLSFSASEANYPLVWGAQDKASVPLQLAAIARGDPKQLSGKIDILVGEDRDASVYSFVLVGKEEIETRMGRIATWHLARPAKAGSYKSHLDLWLAPDYGWYPVQIRNIEASGAVTTQTVNNIVKKDSGSL